MYTKESLDQSQSTKLQFIGQKLTTSACLLYVFILIIISIFLGLQIYYDFCLQDSSNKRQFAKTYISEITKETVFTDKKRNEFLKQWPLIFHEMVYSAVTDMSDMQGYMKKCLEELEKS